MQEPNLTKPRVREFKGKVITRKDISLFNRKYSEHGVILQSDFIKIIKSLMRIFAKKLQRISMV